MQAEAGRRPLLSVVVPTRNRTECVTSAIQSILEIQHPGLELVVQDNSDGRDLAAWIQANVRDARLRYSYTERPLSFIHNFDAAAHCATGEYLVFIGDDDGVNPEIMEAASWAQSKDLDALVVRPSAGYLWRGTGMASTLFTAVTGGVLTIGKFSGCVNDVDVENEMRRLVRNGGLYYLDTNLPKLYHGLVHRRCLAAVHERTGSYFGGLSPDTYASLAIACVARKVSAIDYPLTIPGASKASGAIIEGSIKKHSKELRDAPHFRHRGEYQWCEFVPRVYTVETLWVDSSVAALRAMGREDLVRSLNLPKLAAYCIRSNRGVVRPVVRDLALGLRRMGKSLLLGALQFLWNLALLGIGAGATYVRRALTRIRIILGAEVFRKIGGLDGMVEASNALTRYLRENGYRFADCILKSE